MLRTNVGSPHPHLPGPRRCEQPRRVGAIGNARGDYAAAFSLLPLQSPTKQRDSRTRYRRVPPRDSRAIPQTVEAVLCLRTLRANVGAPVPRLSPPSVGQKAALAQASRAREVKSKSAKALLPSRRPTGQIQRDRPV